MDTLRADKRRRRRERNVAADEANEGGIGSIEEADTRAAVEKEIEKLPVDQREVLVLRLLGDRSYKEIAEITGRPIGTVGWLVSLGLKALGAGLAPLLEGRSRRIARSETAAASLRLDVVRGELS